MINSVLLKQPSYFHGLTVGLRSYMKFQNLFQNAHCVPCLRLQEFPKTMNHGTSERCAQRSAVTDRQILTAIGSQLTAGTVL